jgi:hypothetical protein
LEAHRIFPIRAKKPNVRAKEKCTPQATGGRDRVEADIFRLCRPVFQQAMKSRLALPGRKTKFLCRFENGACQDRESGRGSGIERQRLK